MLPSRRASASELAHGRIAKERERWRYRGRGIRNAVSEKHDTMQLSNEPLLFHGPVVLCTQQPATAARHMHLNDFRRSFDRSQITEDDDVYLNVVSQQ